MKIFLIRHGESIQNTKENMKLLLPDSKVYLSEKGIEQANNAGIFLERYLQENNIDLNNATLWVSPYLRTRQTAQIINEYLSINNYKEDVLLVEQNYGLFSDMSLDEIRNKYKEEFRLYNNFYRHGDKFYAKFPQGESPLEVAIRTRVFIETIFRDNNNPLFIVSHGTTIKTFIMNFMHYSPEWFNHDITMDNCAIRLISGNDKKYEENYIYKGSIKKLQKKC